MDKDSPVSILDVEDLHVEFTGGPVALPAVRGVSFSVRRGETLAVLGESGSGKSVTAQAIMGLLDARRTHVRGKILLDGTDLVPLGRAARRRHQRHRIAMVFQDALAALNPVASVGSQIAEVLRVHDGASARQARAQAIELMSRVRIPAASRRFDNYPHQLSGGMRQRIMIAIALALQPDMLIADEPTTALDVTVQAQILDLLMQLRSDTGMALIFITHDLSVSAEIADRIAVMYAGRVVESGSAADIYRHSHHPYTLGLLQSVPRSAGRGQHLTSIAGSPPTLSAIPTGCAFHPRCPRATDLCVRAEPPTVTIERGHDSVCHFAQEVGHDADR